MTDSTCGESASFPLARVWRLTAAQPARLPGRRGHTPQKPEFARHVTNAPQSTEEHCTQDVNEDSGGGWQRRAPDYGLLAPLPPGRDSCRAADGLHKLWASAQRPAPPVSRKGSRASARLEDEGGPLPGVGG